MVKNLPGTSRTNALPVSFPSEGIRSERILSDRIGATNRNDFFRFRVDVRSSFTARLVNSQRNVNVQLLDRSGKIVKTATRSNSRTPFLQSDLKEGLYFIRVFSSNSTAGTYRLQLVKEEIFDCGCGDFSRTQNSTRARSLFS